MAYNLYSENGLVGDLATIGGLADLREFVSSHGQLRALAELLGSGKTAEVGQLRTDCAAALRLGPPEDVRTTLIGLRELLDEVKEVAIVSP